MKTLSTRLGIAIVGLNLAVQNGCVMPNLLLHGRSIDISGEKDWLGDLASLDILESRMALVLQDGNVGRYGVIETEDPKGVIDRQHINPDELAGNPSKFPGMVLLPKGVRVRWTAVRRVYTLNYSIYSMDVLILDGKHAGTQATVDWSLAGSPDVKGSLELRSEYWSPSE